MLHDAQGNPSSSYQDLGFIVRSNGRSDQGQASVATQPVIGHTPARFVLAVLLLSACAGQSRRTGPQVIDGVVDSLSYLSEMPGVMCGGRGCVDGLTILRDNGSLQHWPGLGGDNRRGKSQRANTSQELLQTLWWDAQRNGFKDLATEVSGRPCRIMASHYSRQQLTFYVDTATISVEIVDLCDHYPDSATYRRREERFGLIVLRMDSISGGKLPWWPAN
jgi:hypothetical protein